MGIFWDVYVENLVKSSARQKRGRNKNHITEGVHDPACLKDPLFLLSSPFKKVHPFKMARELRGASNYLKIIRSIYISNIIIVQRKTNYFASIFLGKGLLATKIPGNWQSFLRLDEKKQKKLNFSASSLIKQYKLKLRN